MKKNLIYTIKASLIQIRPVVLDALYENKVDAVNYQVLNFQKDRSCICLKSVEKPALNPIYTKMRLTNKVICTPYE